MKKTLNDILLNYQSIEVELIENNGEITENIEKELLLNESDLEEKMDGYEKFTRYLKGQIEYLKNMEEMYSKRRKILDNSIKKCKEAMAAALTITGKNKIKTKEFNFSLGKSYKWDIDTLSINEDDKIDLINNGIAENIFKIHMKELKELYKDSDKAPDWVNINEKLFIRVS